MKKFIFYFFVFSLISTLSCKLPKVVKHGDSYYNLMDWEGGEFVYATYMWKGGKFDDALDIIKEFLKLSETRGKNELVLGKFPTGKEWQLGMIVKDDFNTEMIKGYKLNKLYIPSGEYASLKTKGYPEFIFIYWKKFKKFLEKDNYRVDSDVFEIYDGTFDEKIAHSERKGELRYKVIR
ncbi:MAG: hypothetical protein JXB50_14700 [Spirochaetes bacterium]|nr:hypothetical protein [Spirochaetota bacterium]